MEESKERNDKLYEEYLNGNNDYKKLAEKYGITYDNVKKIIYRRNKKSRNN
nr:MAG TPA: Mor transcription activator family [Caudoviricetes sp.]